MDPVAETRQLIARAERPQFDELERLVEALKQRFEFALARDLLELARSERASASAATERARRDVWIAQQAALCTYKDENLHPAQAVEQALASLGRIGLYDPDNRDAETLGLGGDVYKRKFEHGGQLDDLYQAFAFYRAAWEANPDADRGYGGANAAFTLDQLAARADELVQLRAEVSAAGYREQARSLRRRVAEHLEAMLAAAPQRRSEFFFVATLAEVHFALHDFERAGQWLAAARALGPSEWMQQSLVRQIVTIALLHGFAVPRDAAPPGTWQPAWGALTHFLGDATPQALGCARGKIGLALSGGGFRASFFHIGAMARLAEIDVLSGVDVLSTVSGGSIVGAHYYLLVRKLLQSKADRDITRADYVAMIDLLRRDFFAGVERNLRLRTYSNLLANFAMLLSWPIGKRRTRRLGRLYEKLIYATVQDDFSLATVRPLRRLLISPQDEPAWPGSAPGPFNPRFSNWRRRARAPALVINATSLNSGHAWHFTAKWMGEPPALIGDDVDVNRRYRRPYYGQMPSESLRDFSLGLAVGASSCVPALFSPIDIDGLYAGRTVRLVDGGVHDNQGVQGLLAEGCNLILCSDASGQMNDLDSPKRQELDVLSRANETIMSRVREAGYQHLQSLTQTGALRGLLFIHLKRGLAARALDWIGCADQSVEPASDGRTDYGIDKELQAALAAIRTDLDLFSEVEANALMLSGYLMTEHDFKTVLRKTAAANGFDVDAPRGAWEFLQLEPMMRRPFGAADEQRSDLALQLGVASKRFFKVWRLARALRALGSIAILLAAAGVGYAAYASWNRTLPLPAITLSFASLFALACGLLLTSLIVVALFTLAVNLQLWLLDPVFRARGRLRRLLVLRSPTAPRGPDPRFP